VSEPLIERTSDRARERADMIWKKVGFSPLFRYAC